MPVDDRSLAAAAPVCTEVRPGVWRIQLPFHLELNHVNVYLVRLAPGAWMMIDTGFGNLESWSALELGLAQTGVAWSEIRHLFITHTHPDHWGLAPRVLATAGPDTRLTMHAIEAANLRRLAESVAKPSVLDRRLRSWGTPEDQILRITSAFLDIPQRFEAITPSHLFEGGETIETEALGPLRAVFTPGHSPGHLCLYSPRERVLISGDHVLPKITPHIAWMSERDSLSDYRQSLDAVAALDADTVLSGHGDPSGDLAERAAEIKRHHEARCAKIRTALDAGGATTPHEVVSILWPKALSPFNYRFAIYEVMAHLKFMGLDAGLAKPME